MSRTGMIEFLVHAPHVGHEVGFLPSPRAHRERWGGVGGGGRCVGARAATLSHHLPIQTPRLGAHGPAGRHGGILIRGVEDAGRVAEERIILSREFS